VRAASEGARVLTPNGVKKILEQFAVTQVQELKQEVRREFLDMVKAAIADEQKA
jgi:hypothetical protein